MFLSNFFKSAHHTTKRINVLDGFVELEFDLFDLISQVFEEVLCLLVEIT